KMNITGQAIANKLIDQIENYKSHADTSYKNFDITPVFYDSQLELVIPGSGISMKSLLHNLKIFLGRKQTRISGEVVLNKKLYLTIRVQGEPSKTFSGELDDLDNILSEAAKYILKYTQPYLLAYYLYYNYDKNSTDKEEALDMIRYSLTHLPKEDDPMAYTLDGYIKWEEGKFDESIRLYKKAIELDPKYVDAYNGLAYSLYDENRYNEAAEIYKKALSLNPSYTYTNHYIGLNLAAQNKNDSAEWFYKKVYSA
ncbi:MAG: tetratricopeptide repeat protein, partial [Ignavibacteria bacterium]|nr:tetratricopeptide repeat protein [Ignavibacteria bacterium]